MSSEYPGEGGLHPIERDAYRKGYDAHKSGISFESYSGVAGHVWRRGWSDADSDSRQSKRVSVPFEVLQEWKKDLYRGEALLLLRTLRDKDTPRSTYTVFLELLNKAIRDGNLSLSELGTSDKELGFFAKPEIQD